MMSDPFEVDLPSILQISHDSQPLLGQDAFDEVEKLDLSCPVTCLAEDDARFAYDVGSKVQITRWITNSSHQLGEGPISAVLLRANYLCVVYAETPLVVVEIHERKLDKLWEISSYRVIKAKWHSSKDILGAAGEQSLAVKSFEARDEVLLTFEGAVQDFAFATEAVAVSIDSQTVRIFRLFTQDRLFEFQASAACLSRVCSLDFFSATRLLLFDSSAPAVSFYDLSSDRPTETLELDKAMTAALYCPLFRQAVFYSSAEMRVIELSDDLGSVANNKLYRFKNAFEFCVISSSSPTLFMVGRSTVYAVMPKEEAKASPEVKPTGPLGPPIKPERIPISQVSQPKTTNSSSHLTSQFPELQPSSLSMSQPSSQSELKASTKVPEHKDETWSRLPGHEQLLLDSLKQLEAKVEAVQAQSQSEISRVETTLHTLQSAFNSKQQEADIHSMIRQVVAESVDAQFTRDIFPRLEAQLERTPTDRLSHVTARQESLETEMLAVRQLLLDVMKAQNDLRDCIQQSFAEHSRHLNELDTQVKSFISTQSFHPPTNLPFSSLGVVWSELLAQKRYEAAVSTVLANPQSRDLFELLRSVGLRTWQTEVSLSESLTLKLLSRLLETLTEETTSDEIYPWLEQLSTGPFADKKQEALMAFERMTILGDSYPRLSEAKGRLMGSFC
jgi:hypothetical protein